ncbi:MAG: DoxX family membrane protein [Planctomycetota bacterium]
MTLRHKLGLNLAPLFLRFALGAVFVYYGWGKMFETTEFSGQAAATLANLELIDAPAPPGINGMPDVEAPTTPPETPDEALDEVPEPPSETPDDAAPEGDDQAAAWRPAIITAQAELQPAYTALDFTEPVTGSRRLNLVLAMEAASINGYWPGFLSSSTAYSLLAWGATITEFVGGWLILLGFLTRFWALGFTGTMAVAMWLTQFFPVLVGNVDAMWGFLPDPKMDDFSQWTETWKNLHLQLVILCASMALVFTGPGALSLDALLFRRKRVEPAPAS